MPVAPIDLQQLYMQQSYLGSVEHFKVAAKTAAVQSEDKDIHKDSYEKDSTVVKSEDVSHDNKINEREESRKGGGYTSFLSYRKRKRKIIDGDKEEEVVEIVGYEDGNKLKGSKIDILG